MTPLSQYMELLYNLDELRSLSTNSADMIERRMATLYSKLNEGERAAADKMHKTLGIPQPDQKG